MQAIKEKAGLSQKKKKKAAKFSQGESDALDNKKFYQTSYLWSRTGFIFGFARRGTHDIKQQMFLSVKSIV